MGEITPAALTIYDALSREGGVLVRGEQPYQLLPALSKTDRQRLKDSIEREGMLEPVVRDAVTGAVVDGHHREEIARELGLAVPYRDVYFASSEERQAYALAVNLVRRRLSDRQWGEMFTQLVEHRGVNRARGPKEAGANSVTVTELAQEQGVSQVTANRRMALAQGLAPNPEIARQFDEAQETATGRKKVPQSWATKVVEDPELRSAVETKQTSLVEAVKILKEREAAEKQERAAAEKQEREEARRREQVAAGEVSPTTEEVVGESNVELPQRPVSTEADKAPERLAKLNGQLSRVAASDAASVPRDTSDIEMALEVVGMLRSWVDDYEASLRARLRPNLSIVEE